MNGFTQNLTSFTRQAYSGLKLAKHFRLSILRKVFSLMGRREKITASVLLAAAVASLFFSGRNFYIAHTRIEPASGGIYTEGVFGQPSYINPLLAKQETDLQLVKLVFSGLFKYDGNGQLVPDLAEGRPSVSEDQKQYTINLKRQARWHNEKPVTADDVVFTIQLLKDPAYKSPYRSLWLATSVEKLSDYSVKFTTKDVSGPFLQNLTLPILPKSAWSHVDADNFLLSQNNLEAIGSGPYAIREIKKLPSGKVQQVSLEAFNDYYSGQPKLNKLVFKFYDNEENLIRAFQSGEISGLGYLPMGSNLYLEKDQERVRILNLPLPQYQVVFFNLNNKILTDINVRKALSLAVNRQQIIDAVFGGNALLPSSPLLFGRSVFTAGREASLEQAAQILDQAGWKLDPATGTRAKKSQPLEISLVTNDFLPNSRAAEILAAQWKNLNVKVNLAILSTKDLTDGKIKNRAFDVLLFPQKFGADPDPFLFFHSSQAKDPGFNLTGFSDPSADKLITEARTTTDEEVRLQKYQELSRLISEKSPVIFLDQMIYVYALDSRVKNVNINYIYEPNHRFYDAANWYMEERRVWK